MLQLGDFAPDRWLELVRREGVTNTMLVPTMLARIVKHLEGVPAAVPSLRNIAYGGARMPATVLEEALHTFPGVDFVNAYGLTETSSTIALLGPDDHRVALASDDPSVRRRLGSVGRLVPGVEAQVRRDGAPVGPGETGEVWLRGAQVSGEYLGQGTTLDAEGWFPTRDQGSIDEQGYLYIEGRSDDTIIRGGENIAPAEVEDVLLRHPDVADAGVVGIPDDEWGQRILGVVVLRPGSEGTTVESIREFVRARVRGARTPDVVAFVDELPYTTTGKLLRRELVAAAASSTPRQ
jgi:acyl-CoA synthetase (AMP-forming)/AMP-acid ligase II